MISTHCKNNPRIAINLTQQILDFKKIKLDWKVSDILLQLKIFTYGLTQSDLEYLNVIKNAKNGILGIKTLMQITGYDSFTIENFIEPYLFKMELLQKTNRGRTLTTKGLEILKNYHNNQ